MSKKKLQLVGVTAMLIASKYEEMYAPEVRDFVFITDNTYTSGNIRGMEKQMLRVMDYSLGTPLCLHFLRRYSRAGEVRFLCAYRNAKKYQKRIKVSNPQKDKLPSPRNLSPFFSARAVSG